MKDYRLRILATYTESVEYPDAEPLGMRGGAMWFLSDDMAPEDGTEGLWYPILDLAGLGISRHRSMKLLMMVRRKETDAQ